MHEEVAGVRVGMEEPVVQHLHERDMRAALREDVAVDPGCVECREVVDLDAMNVLHREDGVGAELPEDLRYVQARVIDEFGRDALGVLALPGQIELVSEGKPELIDEPLEVELLAKVRAVGKEPRHLAENREVLLDERLDSRPANFDDNRLSAGKNRAVNLGDRSGRARLPFKRVEDA